MKISVISPVYKSKLSVKPLYEEICQVVKSIQDFSLLEIVFIEDCGEDGSWDVIEELALTDKRVVAVQLSRNFGQHNAITAGMDLCTGDWAVVLDCDLQDQPAAISALWNKAKEGYDVVCARRMNRKDAFFKTFRSRAYHVLLEWLSGLSYDPNVANYRLLSRKVIDSYNSMRENSRSFSTQVHWLGFPTAYIDVAHEERFSGKSSYTLSKLVALAVDVAVSYSNRPLRWSIGLGFVISFLSMLVAAWLFLKKVILGIPVPGWTGMMVSLWLIGGIIIANIGIIGIYIGKIYDETRHRPLYAIAKRIN